jgi:DNA primase
VLYGLNWAKKAVVDSGRVVVCEGYTDVIGLHQAGVAEAVATCGTALADGHIRRLTNFAREIVLAYDADAAGQAAAERYYEWERRFEVEIRVVAFPPGADPADLARQDPDGLVAAIAGARPFLSFRLNRLWERADLSSPEGRARAAAAAMALVAEHPNDLVRDQYVMQVADRCRLEPGRLRQMAVDPGGAGRGGQRDRRASEVDAGPTGERDGPVPVAVAGPELEALRLAVHRPEVVAERLEVVLFGHPLARSCFEALSGATTLHAAIESADPQAAELLQRLAVEDTEAEVDDVMRRIVERAGQRALRSLEAEMRQAEPGEQAQFVPTVTWLKLSLEALRAEDPAARLAALESERRLVGWLVARDDAERTEAM